MIFHQHENTVGISTMIFGALFDVGNFQQSRQSEVPCGHLEPRKQIGRYTCLFCVAKRLLGNTPSPFDLHFPMQAARPDGTLFYPVMCSGSLRTCMRKEAASAKEAYFICSGTVVFRSETPHTYIQSASSFCACNAAALRTSGVVSASRT